MLCRRNRGDYDRHTTRPAHSQGALARPAAGWAISERIHQISREALDVQQGSLYPSLHRLERRGWIKARWGTSENNRRAKFYELTRRGRDQLATEAVAWQRLTAAIALVLKTT